MSKYPKKTTSHPINRLSTQDQEIANRFLDQGESSIARIQGPSYQDIQTRAYQLYEERGGNDLENWLEAERLLRRERNVV